VGGFFSGRHLIELKLPGGTDVMLWIFVFTLSRTRANLHLQGINPPVARSSHIFHQIKAHLWHRLLLHASSCNMLLGWLALPLFARCQANGQRKV